MSSPIEKSKIVNQQLAFAKAQLQMVEQEQGFKANACRQAAVSQLCSAVGYYFVEVGLEFAPSGPGRIFNCLTYLNGNKEIKDSDFRLQQLAALGANVDSWLYRVAQLEETLLCAKPSSEPSEAENIIAVSAASSGAHWQTESLSALRTLVSHASELFNEQRAIAAEY